MKLLAFGICILFIIGAINVALTRDILIQLKPTVKALGSDPVAAFPTKATK